MPEETKYNSFEGCPKDIHTNNLYVWMQHLLKCSVCRQNSSPEILAEIKERYGQDLTQLANQDNNKKPTQETPESQSKTTANMTPEERRARLDAEIAKLPSMRAIREQLAKLAGAVSIIAERLKTESTQTEAVNSQPTQTEAPKQVMQQPEQGKVELTPDQIRQAEAWINKQKQLQGMGTTEPSAPKGEIPYVNDITNIIERIGRVVQSWKGGGGQPPPPTPEDLVTKILMRYLERKDPMEYFQAGMEFGHKYLNDAMKLAKSGGASVPEKEVSPPAPAPAEHLGE